MSQSTTTAQHGLSEHSHGAGVPIQIRSARVRSANPNDFEEVTQRDEQWRYLATDRLGGLVGELEEFAGDLALTAPDQVTSSWANQDNPAFGSAGLPEDRISASAWAACDAAYLISIPKSEEELFVTLKVNSADLTPSALHVIVDAKPFANATVVIDHSGDAVLAENIEIVVGDEAQLTVVSIQDWNASSIHTAAHFAKLGRNSRLKHIVISLGGKTVRVVPSVEYTAPGADANLLGAYFADSGQYLENRPFIDHSVANCKSRVTYKGALQGEKAHTVWVGDVLIRQAAEGTDTYELNRNLLLTDGARADSVPNLEIETGQIEGAGHASASGRFDDEQLFYLQARGISEAEARKLVVFGFLNEIIQQIGIEDVETRLATAIEEELARSVS
jgi:Fe-S cluster assembly protein SufD